jgi:LytS/YehU family sensor histidine kinase
LVGWRTRALRRRAERLEAIVATRTDELRRSNAELARLNAIERDEKLAARLGEEKARLEVLRYQLNPHFLFNALNSVCASINHAPAAARGMVVRIAEFCRQTLHRPGADESAMTIGQEIAMLRSYLEIEQMRLGDLLTVEIACDPAAEGVRIPPFLLLPLVENAVKYGTATSVDRVEIKLRVRPIGSDGETLTRSAASGIEIEVSNTGKWLEPGHHSAPSTGIGLENLRQRLARYYPDAHELITTSEGAWVIVRVRLLQPISEGVPLAAS